MSSYVSQTVRALALIAAFAVLASSCAGESAVVDESVLPVASVAPAPTPTQVVEEPEVVPSAELDISAFPEPRYPSMVVPRDAEHEAAGIAAGNSVTSDGIVLAIGYSTTRDILTQYERLITTEFPFVSAASSGMDIERWASRASAYERTSDTIAEVTGVEPAVRPEIGEGLSSVVRTASDENVQVLWIQVALAGTAEPRVDYMRALINETIREATIRWPNLKQIYLIGREYGGYATDKAPDGTVFAGEPGNWASSFAIDLVVADNLDREDGLWVGHGPYFWAESDTERADGVSWPLDLFKPDGRHLTNEGAAFVANMLHNFFLEDPTAAWYQADLAAAE